MHHQILTITRTNKTQLPKSQIIPKKEKKEKRTKPIFSNQKQDHKNQNLTKINNTFFQFNNLLSIEGEKRIKPSYKYWP
jgi:hypothetical protein